METERLILDAIRAEDKEDYFLNLSHDRRVLETFICRYAETPADLDITPYLTNEKMFAIRLKDSGRLIGIILYFGETETGCEIGYGMGSPHWGKGYGTEAARRFLDYLFGEKGFQTVCASFFTGNEASRRVMEKCGMTFSRFAEKELTYLDRERDLTYYAITREDWEALKACPPLAVTERLILAGLTPAMAQDLHEASLDEDTRRFVPDEVFETPEEARQAIEHLMAQYAGLSGPQVYAALCRSHRRFVGYVQMAPLGGGQWEIGYHIDRRYTGQGLATEAVRAFLPVMARRLGLSEVTGVCLRDNAASCRVLEKCGFEQLYAGPGDYQGQERQVVRYVWRMAGRE